MQMRYGVNPHQAARVSINGEGPLQLLAGVPSYVNVLDALNGWQLVRAAREVLGVPAAASFKHASPAGAAIAGALDETMRETRGLGAGGLRPLAAAYLRARDCDPKSSFGDMVAVSEPVDVELADLLCGVTADGIVAPDFEEGTVETLRRKKRGGFVVFRCDAAYVPPAWERRDVFGVVLEQEADQLSITADLLRVMTGGAMTAQAVCDALLGMVVMRYTQSNSVAFVKGGMTLGVAAGQQSRVDCTRLAGSKTDVWWLRRHPTVRSLTFLGDLSLQDRLNWQMVLAQGDVLPSQQAGLDQITAASAKPRLTVGDRAGWLKRLKDVTVVHDGYIPFRDNIDHASLHGAGCVVEPGGSVRAPEISAACEDLGITLVHTGTRLFHH